MSRSITILWTVAGLISLASLSVAWRLFHGARAERRLQTTRLESLRHKDGQIRRLKAATPRASVAENEPGSLAPRLTQALSAAGLPGTSLASLTPRSQTVTASDGRSVVKRSAALSISPIALPELGSFLAAWRTSEPRWVVASIELAPETGATAPPGANLPLRVNLVLEALAAEDARRSP